MAPFLFWLVEAWGDFFSGTYDENLVELLGVKLTKLWEPLTPMTGPTAFHQLDFRFSLSSPWFCWQLLLLSLWPGKSGLPVFVCLKFWRLQLALCFSPVTDFLKSCWFSVCLAFNLLLGRRGNFWTARKTYENQKPVVYRFFANMFSSNFGKY